MKKLIILFITIISLSGCIDPDTKRVKSGGLLDGCIYGNKFTFEGHTYIEFKDHDMVGQGFVHDPDCLLKDLDSLSIKNNTDI